MALRRQTFLDFGCFDEDFYVYVPLEETYQATWAVLPKEIRSLVEPPQ